MKVSQVLAVALAFSSISNIDYDKYSLESRKPQRSSNRHSGVAKAKREKQKRKNRLKQK